MHKIGLSLRRAQWAAEEQEKKQASKAVEQKKHIAVQTVLSGIDTEQLTNKRQQGTAAQQTDTESAERTDEKAEVKVDDIEKSKEKETDEKGEAVEQGDKAVEADAGDTEVPKEPVEPSLQGDETTEVKTGEIEESKDTDEGDQGRESLDAPKPAGDEGVTEKEPEAGADN